MAQDRDKQRSEALAALRNCKGDFILMTEMSTPGAGVEVVACYRPEMIEGFLNALVAQHRSMMEHAIIVAREIVRRFLPDDFDSPS